MKDLVFAITDIETTGGGINGNRITEICIVLLKGETVIDKYYSLVNPQKKIPSHITALTGIDDDMVGDAPKFGEIAKNIEEFTQDAVFVAHNVNFDYNVLRNEFKELGFDFTRKKLCTVRLSRKLIPGLFSYSLGRMCDSLNIPIVNRHRAEGDTDATVILFQRLLSLDNNGEVVRSFLHTHSRQATLPPHVAAEQIYNLPETPGIYLFKDRHHKVIYAGKAINIKKRVISHFYERLSKEYNLFQETYYIDYETTGNELLALLLETQYIKKFYPKYNQAQKRTGTTYQIINYRNQRGIIQLALGKTRNIRDSIGTFYSRAQATEKLEQLCEGFNLCPRYCTLQTNVEICSHYRIKNCEGICKRTETVEEYNSKVKAAIASFGLEAPSYIIREKGRHFEEEAFVLIREGRYQGYGYIDTNLQITSIEDYEPFLKTQEATFHTHQILNSYMRKYSERNVLVFDTAAVIENHECFFGIETRAS